MEEIYANVEYDKPQVSIRPSTPAPAAELSFIIKANLTERLRVSGDKLSSVSAERDQLKDNFTALMDNFIALTQEKDRRQLLCKQNKTCPEGWKMFSCSCYLLSTRDDSWTNARTDCRANGADLVIIDSPQEQKFLSSIAKDRAWIGLSDKEMEGTWKWVDGTPLTGAYWGAPPDPVQPDDNGGKEDCVEILLRWNSERNWNDNVCTSSFSWICEKLV
ncbi:CD209 antigen-like protein A [Pungitius pungitius]|uniref:CD209 antigen-like protein A n=1 Tax=Pungitius pungitius TaxID=134920 RepID=UPI002E117A06